MFTKRKSMGLVVALVASLYILCNKNCAEASSFSHTHSENCYETETRSCSNHYFYTYSSGSTLHCPNCLVQTPHTITAYYDTCRNGYVESQISGYRESCNNCGYVRKDDPRALDVPHPYTVSVLTCTITEGSGLGTVSLDKASSEWTNGKVTLIATVSGLSSSLSLDSAPYNFGSGYGSGNTFDVTSNGTYSVTVRTSDGNTASSSVSVDNIDTTPPTLNLSKSTEAWTESGLTVSASAVDGESGIAGISFDGGDYSDTSSIHVSTNRTVTVSTKDRAGNVTTQNITISNIGRDPKIVEAERAEREAREKAEQEAKEKAEREAKEKAEREAQLKKESQAAASAGGSSSTTKRDTTASKDKSNGDAANKVTSDNGSSNSDKEEKESDSHKENDVAKSDGIKVGGETAGAITGLLVVKDATGRDAGSKNTDTDKGYADELKGEGSNENEYMEAMTTDNLELKSGSGGEAGTIFSGTSGKVIISFGIILFMAGVVIFLKLNYIYCSETGRIKLISLVGIKRYKQRIIITVSEKKLTRGGRYLIYFSPVNRILKKKRKVYVMISENDTLINTDEGVGFTY